MIRGPVASPPLDAASAVYPDRLIRPLPKRKIRARLSSEAASSISYPLIVPSSPPSFNSPHTQMERVYPEIDYTSGLDGSHEEHDLDCQHKCPECEQQDHHSSDEEGYRVPSSYKPYMWPEEQYAKSRSQNNNQPPPPNSSNSSADGYESFENTNNKKKRKIPISGGLGALTADVPGAQVPTQSVNVPYPETSRPNGLGSAGAGRDRGRKSGRFLNDRKPLANATHNVGHYANDNNIISKSMANAKGSDIPPSARGQENVSLMQRPKQPKDQNFTFECKSDSAAELVADEIRTAQTAAVPTTYPKAPAVPAARARPGQAANGAVPPPAQYPSGQAPAQQAPAPQKRRDPNWWLRSANRRKEQKRSDNYYNPPNPNNALDNYWCPFCEFEDLYGAPFMLGRRYEIKERRRRRERETNQKRLEAAKAKSRKGKKSKSGAKRSEPAVPAANAPSNQPYDPAYGDPPQDDLSQEGDFFDDDEDYDGMAEPAPLDPQAAYGARQHRQVPGAFDLPELDRSRTLPNM